MRNELSKKEIEYMDALVEGTPAEASEDLDLRRIERAVLVEVGKAQATPAMLDAGAEVKAFKPVRAKRTFAKRWVAIIVAVMLISSSFAYGASQGWDVELAKKLGMSDLMKDIEGGYVNIGASDVKDGVEITAVNAIGDDTAQWIKIDTNVEWVDEPGYFVYYSFDNIQMELSDLLTGRHLEQSGSSWGCFNNEGKVSCWYCPTGGEKMNRAKVDLLLKDFRRVVATVPATEDEEEEIISEETITDEEFHLRWKNVYDANVRKFKPDEKLTLEYLYTTEDSAEGSDMDEWTKVPVETRITEIRVTPLTIYIVGEIDEKDEKGFYDEYIGSFRMEVDKLRLKDGSLIDFDSEDVSVGYSYVEGNKAARIDSNITLGMSRDDSASWWDGTLRINGNEVSGIFINGQEISLDCYM